MLLPWHCTHQTLCSSPHPAQQYVCHRVAMVLPWVCHRRGVFHKSLPCSCHVIAIVLRWCCHVVAIICVDTMNHCHRVAMSLPSCCHVHCLNELCDLSLCNFSHGHLSGRSCAHSTFRTPIRLCAREQGLHCAACCSYGSQHLGLVLMVFLNSCCLGNETLWC